MLREAALQREKRKVAELEAMAQIREHRLSDAYAEIRHLHERCTSLYEVGMAIGHELVRSRLGDNPRQAGQQFNPMTNLLNGPFD